MHRTSLFLVLLAASGCCFDGLGQTVAPPSTATPPMAGGSGTGPLLPGGPTAGGLGAPISFGAGAVPDPTIVLGMAGGPVNASTFSPSCYGHIQMAPSHVLTVTSTVPTARIAAFSTRSSDLTLLIRQPSGGYLCNDDSDGLNPQIDTPLYPGDYQIYVGTYGTSASEPYELGVSANPMITASTLHAPPPFVPVVGSGTPGAMSGSASLSSSSGGPPGLYVGQSCSYTETRVAPLPSSTGGAALDCQWRVTCGGADVYGGSAGGGYQPCLDPAWSAGTYALDTSTTSTDGDPAFVFVGSRLTVSDDAAGSYGVFTLVMDTTAAAPPPEIFAP